MCSLVTDNDRKSDVELQDGVIPCTFCQCPPMKPTFFTGCRNSSCSTVYFYCEACLIESIDKHYLDACPVCRKTIKITRNQKMMRPASEEYRQRAGKEKFTDLVRMASDRAAGSGIGALRAEYLDQVKKEEEERKKESAERYPEDLRIARELQEAENAAAGSREDKILELAGEIPSYEEDARLAKKLAEEEAARIEASNKEDEKLAKQLYEEEKAALERERMERMEREREDAALALRLDEKASRQKRGSPAAASAGAESPDEEKPSRRKRRPSDSQADQAAAAKKR